MHHRYPVIRALLAAGALAVSASAGANDLRLSPGAQAADIKAMARDLSAGLSQKSLGPAEAFGVMGFGLGAFFSYADVDDSEAWRRATGGRDANSIRTLGLRARKGLPSGIDVSAHVAELPGNDGTLLGGAVQFAFLEGGVATPAVAVQLGYSRLTGVDDFAFDVWNVNLSASKGFVFITPYAGIGYVTGKLDPDNPALSTERPSNGRVFAGARIPLGLLDLTPEIEQSSSNFVASLRLGVTF